MSLDLRKKAGLDLAGHVLIYKQTAASPRSLSSKNTTKAGIRPTTIWRVKATK
jgi:hypothetical protein